MSEFEQFEAVKLLSQTIALARPADRPGKNAQTLCSLSISLPHLTAAPHPSWRCKKALTCPICAHVEAGKRAALVQAWATAKNPAALVHMVVTQRQRPLEPVADAVGRILNWREAWRCQWTDARRRSYHPMHDFYASMAGGFWRLEVKPGEIGPHAHLHGIFSFNYLPEVDQDRRSPQLERLLQEVVPAGYFRQTYARPITDDDRRGAIVEAVKYVTKFKTPSSFIWEMHAAVHGKRIFCTYGDLRGFPMPTRADWDTPEELIHGSWNGRQYVLADAV